MDVKAAFKTARYKRVSVLDETSARELILTAQKQGTLSFSPTAVDRIVKLTAGHPYFTQLVCQLIWDELQPRAANGTIPQVEVRDVDAVVAKAPEAGENICEWIWDGLPPAEKVIYAAIAHATETRPNVSAEEVTEMLQRHGVRFFTRELELAPDTLVRWEMLQEQDGRYGFFIELMRRWVAARKPLPKVKDELDRVVPLADSLYQSGDGFYRRGNLDSSQNLLQQALTVNPNHLKARLLLGQVLVEQGNLEGAVRELEEAHRHDEAAARYPLIRTLLLRQEEMERAGASDGALAACDRVLELSPGNNVAMERRASVWRVRGDRALAADRLDEAAEAYGKIQASDMLDKVAARGTKLKVDKLARDAQSQIGIEQWEKAAGLYQQLAALDPGEKNWKAGLERCQTEFKFAKLYAEALQAVKEENWRKAQSSLIEILGSRAEYKDAPDLLVRALRPNPPPPGKHSVFGPFLTLYVKCAFALAMCAVSGLVRVQSGNGGAGSIMGFYLGTAVLLALVLGIVEMIWQALGDRRGGGMEKLTIAKPVGR